MNVNMTSLGVKGFLLGVLLIAGACSGGSKPPPGKACLLNSDCTDPLSCSYGICHVTCNKAGDCPTGQDCIKAPVGNVCQLPVEAHCDYRSDCTTPLVCALDRKCRSQCKADIDCPTPTQKCVGSAPDQVCAEPAAIDSTTNLLKDAQSTPVPAERPDAGAGDGASADSPAGTGDAACNGTLLPDGSCDYCPAGACDHGACMSGDHDYTCKCDMGYTLSGKSCLPTDSCKANNQCTPDYPCQNTAPPGQACLGQYAAWPVSDSMAMAPTKLPSFADNGDRTVTDGVTRLVWQLDVAPPGNCSNGSADAGADAAAPSCTFADATAYCAGLGLAGHKDWRVPSKIELESLLDFSKQSDPMIATPFLTQPPAMFWTASHVAPIGSSSAWLVIFSSALGVNGAWPRGVADTARPPSVRCVSGTGIGSTTPAVHYAIHAGAIDAGVADAALPMDTVTDNWTGLTWQRGTGPSTSNPGTRAYCASLGVGFRVPTLKELLTVVNPLYTNPAIDAITFPGTPAATFWSATVNPVSGACAYMDFATGASIGFSGDCLANSYVRCVR